MNTESVDCRKVENYDSMKNPGDFCFADRDGHKGIMIILPGGSFCHLAIEKGSAPDAKCWGWDGNEDKPTITPSIHQLGHWHGFMRNGRLESC